MNDWNELFRLYPRLSKKLSNEEIKGIKTFIENQVFSTNSNMFTKLVYLETTKCLEDKKQEESIGTLSKQIQNEKFIAKEYKREFGKLSDVLRSREARFQKHLKHADDEINQLKEELDAKKISLEELELKYDDQMEINDKFQEKIIELERMCLKLVKEKDESLEMSRLSGELLKLKYTISNKDKEIKYLRHNFLPFSKTSSCNGKNCFFAKYFNDCKQQLISKCEETAILNFRINDLKRQLKEKSAVIESIKGVKKI